MITGAALSFLNNCISANVEVPTLEISKLGPLTFVTSFAEKPSEIMANNVTCGVSTEPETAALKAMVEFYERRVFQEGIERDDLICSRIHSDGVASYPMVEDAVYFQEARRRAYAEAWERYVWATWWDDEDYGHSLQSFENSIYSNDPSIKQTIDEFAKILLIENFQIVEPLTDSKDLRVVILFLKINGLGYISGGAAGKTSESTEIFFAAFSELIRHGLGVKRFLKTKALPTSFYEKRLMFFGCGDGNGIVTDRLNKVGMKLITTPKLEHDGEIESNALKNLIYTHRCLFEGQPPFVSGKLERLCL